MFDKINRFSIEFTKDCNFNCEYCHQRHIRTHDGGHISFDDLKKRVDFINNLPVLSQDNVDFALTGGEVTMYEDIFIKYMRYLNGYIRTRNKSFSLMTNGSNVSAALRLADEGILKSDRIGISWDGLHNSDIRKNELGDKYILDQLNILAKSKYRRDVFIQFSLWPKTIKYLYETVKFLKDKGLNNLGAYIIRGYDYKDEDAELYNQQLEKISKLFIDSYINEAERLRYFTVQKCWIDYGFRKKESIEDTTKCHKIGQTLHLTLNEDIFPCIYFGDHNLFKIGDMKNGLNPKSLEAFKKEYLTPAECINKQNCTLRHCLTCEAANFRFRGGFHKRDISHCKMREIERKWFYRIMGALKPYITDYALETFWGRTNEQYMQSEQV